MARFARIYDGIDYDVLWQSSIVNAQAIAFPHQRCVRLYGGLVRHPAATGAGISFALAHETGHHLGGAPFHPYLPWLSNEERADEWAEQVGLPAVFGAKVARFIVRVGRSQLQLVKSSLVTGETQSSFRFAPGAEVRN